MWVCAVLRIKPRASYDQDNDQQFSIFLRRFRGPGQLSCSLVECFPCLLSASQGQRSGPLAPPPCAEANKQMKCFQLGQDKVSSLIQTNACLWQAPQPPRLLPLQSVLLPAESQPGPLASGPEALEKGVQCWTGPTHRVHLTGLISGALGLCSWTKCSQGEPEAAGDGLPGRNWMKQTLKVPPSVGS